MTDRHNDVILRAYCASVLVAGAAVALYAATELAPVEGRPFHLPWALLAAGFLAAERYNVHLEVRKDVHTLTFSELPLTIGLIFAAPVELVVARLVVSAFALQVFRRVSPVKLAFNAGIFGLDAGVALIVYHWVLGAASPVEPRGWVAALSAIAVSHVIGAFLVSVVMRLAGAPVSLESQLLVVGVALSAAVSGCAVGLGASAVLWQSSHAWVLLLIIGSALGYFFTSFVRIRERHRALSTLHSFTTRLASGVGSRELLGGIVEGIASLLNAGRVVLLIPGDARTVRVDHTGGKTSVNEVPAADLDLVTAFSWIEAGDNRRRHLQIAGISIDPASSAVARLALPDRDGLVVVDRRLSSVRSFDDEDVQLLETAAGHAASALQNAQLVERLRDEANFRARQALHDDITDLPNQRALVEELNGELGAGTELIMLTVRIHSLREVNETLGRAVGDEMLRQVAERLQAVAPECRCARSGTDEFTVVMPGGQAEADDFAHRIVEAFDNTILTSGVALAVTVGVGMALAPQHGTEAEILLRRASLAASRSAIEGTTVTTWAADRDPYDPQRLTIAADLRDAIPAGELEVHFQPQLDMTRNRIIGAEALVRWAHPRLGQLRPDQFIAAAEHTGAIDALTSHVLEVAARTGRRWHDLGWDLDIAVNLSARNLASPRFSATVADILGKTGFPASSLTLELTESSVMTEAERALKTLHELHDLGIALSIDDFGTGYSSLAHLRRLPVSEIKIDKSFVFDLTTSESDEAIVRSMVDLGKTLSLTVVVEGVETVEVRDRLQQLGADRLQGYLLSRPLSASAFEHWLHERQPRAVPPVGQVVNLHQRR